VCVLFQSIRDLQCSVRDGILLLRALLEEIETNAEKEKLDMLELYDAIQEHIARTKEALLQEINRYCFVIILENY